MFTKNDIENILKNSNPINVDTAFIILQSMFNLANTNIEDNLTQQLLLRILDRKEEFNSFGDALNSLVRHFGLYPYLDTENITIKDAFARELHRPSLLIENNVDNEGIVFHKVQSEIFQYLINGENIILSAPTSFGK
ncbi:TPA: helicase, partial [Haemophilus influenzae]